MSILPRNILKSYTTFPLIRVEKDVGWSGIKHGFTGKKTDKRGYKLCYRDGIRVPCSNLEKPGKPQPSESKPDKTGQQVAQPQKPEGAKVSPKEILAGIKEMFEDVGKVKPEDILAFKGVLSTLNQGQIDKLKKLIDIDDSDVDQGLVDNITKLALGEVGEAGVVEPEVAPENYEDWVSQLPTVEEDTDEIENPTAENVGSYLAKILEHDVSVYHVKEVARLLSRMSEEELAKLEEKTPTPSLEVMELADRIVDLAKEGIEEVGEEEAEDEGREGDIGGGREGDVGEPEEDGGQLEGEAEGPDIEGTDREREDIGEPTGEEVTKRIPATREEVDKRLNQYTNFFRKKGLHDVANWMDSFRDHIASVGTEEALKELGEEIIKDEEEDDKEVQYPGWSSERTTAFTEKYLEKNGIALVHDMLLEEGKPVISNVPVTFQPGAEDVYARGEEGDITPEPPVLENKLEEAKKLPGLGSSEDLSVIMGGTAGEPITNFTPEVLAKLNEKYGENGWVVKAYSEKASAGFGVYFSQRVNQLHQDAKNVMWDSGVELSKYGFSHLRDENNKVIGIKHEGGDEYKFDSDEYKNTIQGDVKTWADKAALAAPSEQGTALIDGGKQFMGQPAFPIVGISNEERAQGITFKKGKEGRVHIVTRDGKAEIVPHSTWLKDEDVPVVFEDDDTLAMAQAAADAINALPESDRQGQIYAPDVGRTAEGFKVIEANPSNAQGSSGYLQDNPYIIDAYVSHLTNREPAHVRFIRKLLTTKKREEERNVREGEEGTAGEDIGGGERSDRGGGEVGSEHDTGTAKEANVRKLEDYTPEGFSKKLSLRGVTSLPIPYKKERWEQPQKIQERHNKQVLQAARKGGFYIQQKDLPDFIKTTPNIGGMEHDVHYDEKNNRYYKMTKGGHFGQNKDVHEYLARHEVSNKLWPKLGYKFHGVTKDAQGNPQIIMSMAGVAGGHPTQKEIHQFFLQNGWKPNEGRAKWMDGSDAGYWSWRDPKSGTVINDTHIKNFVKTGKGKLAPIDVDILPGDKMPKKFGGENRARVAERRRVRIAERSEKSLVWNVIKGKGEPCKQGETSAKDQCIPATGKVGSARLGKKKPISAGIKRPVNRLTAGGEGGNKDSGFEGSATEHANKFLEAIKTLTDIPNPKKLQGKLKKIKSRMQELEVAKEGIDIDREDEETEEALMEIEMEQASLEEEYESANLEHQEVLEDYTEASRNKLKEVFSVGENEKSHIILTIGADTDIKDSVGKAIDFLSGLVHRSVDSLIMIKAKKIGLGERAHADARETISLNAEDGVFVAVHEIGHCLETRNIEPVLEFWKKRVGDEEAVSMGRFGCEPWEYGRKDNFEKVMGNKREAYYTGKVYMNKVGGELKIVATEIVSMGVQKLYEDPVEFAKKDPEYFSFIIKLITEGKKNEGGSKAEGRGVGSRANRGRKVPKQG